jgi:glyoxylase-like metal-dependent hydrolase (beta-lactamase superfamily II)
MIRRAVVAVCALSLALAGAAHAQTPAASVAPPRDPMVLAGSTQKVSAHVFVIPDRSTPLVPNVGVIVGSKAALVVDTGLGEKNGAIVLAEARKAAPGRALYLVSTHFHPEHDLGASAFPPSTRMIRSKDEIADIDEFGLTMADRFAGFSAVNAALLKGAAFRKADIVFDESYDLDLGGVSVKILAMGPNHTRGDTAVFVPADQVLFAGDVAMKAQPAFASPYSNVDHWLASLDRFTALKPKVIVPSHGPMGGIELVDGYRLYLMTVRNRTAALKSGGASVDQAVAQVGAELKGAYPDAGRLAGAVRAAYAQAGAKAQL